VGEIQTTDTFQAVSHGGYITFTKREMVKKPSFVDYLRSGYAISFTCAIDFTASNGHPSLPASLHHIGADGQV
jgi:hypothetical protein